jgi:diguanylate cyclase (GGDEF)-like protein
MPHEIRTRPLVLLVDDDEMMRMIASASLSDGELDVICAEGGAEALDLFVERRPDIILLDVMMPDVDGFTVCSRIRTMPGGSAVPILMMTALDDVASIDRAYECGATDFVTKPISYGLLAHRVRYLLRSSRAFMDIREGARSLARAQRLARLVQWELDLETQVFQWSETSSDVFNGLEGAGDLHYTLLQWVHPKDRTSVADVLLRGEAHHVEYRLMLPSGEERFVHQEAETDVDEVSGRGRLIGTAQDVTELRDAERRVAHLAFYDALTSLPNRAHACRFLESALGEAVLCGESVAVISLDLDLFRRVNDSIGHFAGNALLQEVAGRIRSVVKEREGSNPTARPQAIAARLGGDEFVVILRDVQTDEEAPLLFRHLAERISQPYLIDGAEVVVSCSAGLATYPLNGGDVDTLLMHADAAMHSAKELGRNGFQLFAAEIQQKVERRLGIESRLRSALAAGRGLELHYQPKVVVPSGRVAGVEALLRWIPDEAGPISPTELVAVAEETGLVLQLGDWVLLTACQQASRWSVEGPRPIRVAVNISARQFREPDFAQKVAGVLADTGLSPDLLELEITEGVMMFDTLATGRMLEELKRLGVRISLDDFGTGYSSLAYLTHFPIDTLKIDRSFIKEIGVTRKSEAIVGAIIALSQSLEIDIVAEGVETDEQRLFLERFGELEIQGWLYAKAMPGAAAATWIVKHEQAIEPSFLATG